MAFRVFSSRGLCLIALILWLLAGINICLVAIASLREGGSFAVVLLWLMVSMLFFRVFLFPKVVSRNVLRLRALQGSSFYPWQALSLKSWLVMGLMISVGVLMRRVFHASPSFIGGFYLGLGYAMLRTSMAYIKELNQGKGGRGNQ